MIRAARTVRAYAMAAAASAALGFAAQSCGVMSSGDNCAEKATCSDDGTVAEGPGDEAGGDALDVAVEAVGDDVVSEDVASSDVTAPDISNAGDANDATSEDARVGSDARDATSDDAATEEAARLDECVPRTEICNNGIDDDCNGFTDCADPACQTAGYACAAAAPASWVGPVALYEGTAAATACPAGYALAANSNGGLSASGAQCTCACNAAGQQCSASTGQFYSDTNCGAGTQCTATVSIPSGACTAVTHCGGASVSFNAAAPTWSGGNCTPQATTNTSPWTFATTSRVCSWSATPDVPGGCGNATDQCVSRPTSPYGTSLCIYHVGDPAPGGCPSGPYSVYHVYYLTANDTRACTPCLCGGSPTGGGCTGSIAVYSGSSCTGTVPGTFTFGTTTCLSLSSPQNAQGTYTPSAGTCAAPSGGQPSGGVQGAGATAVCCTP
jgi:hypothetical protein